MADRPAPNSHDAQPPGSVGPLTALIAIDACRPGSDDFDRMLPSDVSAAIRRDELLTDRYRAVQQLDHAVAATFSAVPVPSGLADRLLAALAQQQADQASSQLVTSPSIAPVELAPPGPSPFQGVPAGLPFRSTRRRWLQIASGSLAVTAAGLGGLFWWRRSNEAAPLVLQDVLTRTLAFHQSHEGRIGELVPISRVPAPAEFRMSNQIVGLREIPRWQKLDGRLLGRAGVAYELGGPNGSHATLYVLSYDGRPEVFSLPEQPPEKPHSTEGYALAGWREDDRIQVLVVDGDVDRYRSFLTPARDIA